MGQSGENRAVQKPAWATRWDDYGGGRRKPRTITCSHLLYRLVVKGDYVYALSYADTSDDWDQKRGNLFVYNRHTMALERTVEGAVPPYFGEGPAVLAVDDTETIYTASYCTGSTNVEARSGTNNSLVNTFKGNLGGVKVLAADAARRLYSGADDTTIRVWSCATGVCITTLRGHTGAVISLAIDANNVLFSGSADTTIRVWSNHTHVKTLNGHSGSVVSLAVGQDGTLVSGSHDGTVRVWSADDFRPIRTYDGTKVKAVAVGMDGNIVSLRATGEIRRYTPHIDYALYNVGDSRSLFDSPVAFGLDGTLYVGSNKTSHIF